MGISLASIPLANFLFRRSWDRRPTTASADLRMSRPEHSRWERAHCSLETGWDSRRFSTSLSFSLLATQGPIFQSIWSRTPAAVQPNPLTGPLSNPFFYLSRPPASDGCHRVRISTEVFSTDQGTRLDHHARTFPVAGQYQHRRPSPQCQFSRSGRRVGRSTQKVDNNPFVQLLEVLIGEQSETASSPKYPKDWQ